ncbi:MAG TPA: protease inhibitor I42 family protein [Spirochaetota bacterium]|nr:protease inhibitor I42 family protein [Spirochaetota bacterium]HPJ35379.1 protease inhibitor I42 family protein [Spirochaetota bacterium]
MRISYSAIVIISALAIVTGCLTKPVTVMVKDGDQTIKARAGEKISIQLKSQLSTGYSWKIMEMPDAVTLIKENVISDEKTLNRTGGYEIQEFVFKASKTGGVVVFKYGEHWKKKPVYKDTAKITIQVD